MDLTLLDDLRQVYDANAAERDAQLREAWKLAERSRFLSHLQEANLKHLLELGAGPGGDGLFFKEHGLDVHCTDLSEKNVALCREKGLSAEVMDFSQLTFGPSEFDCVYAFNSLLHLPLGDLENTLQNVQSILRAGGLFYWGQYGGIRSEGVYEEDRYRPKRFFSLLLDDQIQEIASRHFRVRNFRKISLGDSDPLHFQALMLEKETSTG